MEETEIAKVNPSSKIRRILKVDAINNFWRAGAPARNNNYFRGVRERGRVVEIANRREKNIAKKRKGKAKKIGAKIWRGCGNLLLML